MTNYRRLHTPGATWFFTINLSELRSRLLVERIDTLREALRYVHTRHPFRIEAMVVLSDHLHAVWTLPPGDADYPMRWRLLKSWLSRHVPAGERRRDSRMNKGERGIWQRRYGNTRFAMSRIWNDAWITSISIRCTVTLNAQRIGRIPRSTATSTDAQHRHGVCKTDTPA